MSSLQILIADDHELFRRTLRTFIESQMGWQVCGEAGDGLEAVEKARKLNPDLVLMDINMPRMDGLEATRRLRQHQPDSKVIVVTQNHTSIAREQAAKVQANGYVTKSDLVRDLPTMINRVFAERAAVPVVTEDASPGQQWLRGSGALGRLVHAFDWASTPLGELRNGRRV